MQPDPPPHLPAFVLARMDGVGVKAMQNLSCRSSCPWAVCLPHNTLQLQKAPQAGRGQRGEVRSEINSKANLCQANSTYLQEGICAAVLDPLP